SPVTSEIPCAGAKVGSFWGIKDLLVGIVGSDTREGLIGIGGVSGAPIGGGNDTAGTGGSSLGGVGSSGEGIAEGATGGETASAKPNVFFSL
ncbi:hypothetical protein, partial [Streptococcus pseudopneumoniae]|uniref:hypothetical protein n=1 Tax=Streptococcus pseudopneumoniae TaxID=257758 RepID=UPI00237A10EC